MIKQGIPYIIVATLLVACQPSKKFYFRERVVEKHMVKPAIATYSDSFRTQRASGKVNTLFVVDNTDSFNQSISVFSARYKGFLNLLTTSSESQHLDWVSQVVTTPDARIPKKFVFDKSTGDHLDELFKNKLLDGSQAFHALTPLASAKAGLESKAFEGRSDSSLFITFIVGADSDPKDTMAPETLAYLEKSLGFHQLHIFVVHNINNGNCPAPAPQPYREAALLASEVNKLTLNQDHKHFHNICNGTWEDFENALYREIVDHRKKYILSKVPYMPEGMRVKVKSRGLHFGADYEFKSDTNEIILKAPTSSEIPEDSILEVQYYLKPPESPDLTDQEPKT